MTALGRINLGVSLLFVLVTLIVHEYAAMDVIRFHAVRHHPGALGWQLLKGIRFRWCLSFTSG